MKARIGDAGDGYKVVVEQDGLADDTGIAAEAALPEGIAQNGDGCGLFILKKAAAKGWVESTDREEIRGLEAGKDFFSFGGRGGSTENQAGGLGFGSEAGDRDGVCLEVTELARGKVPEVIVAIDADVSVGMHHVIGRAVSHAAATGGTPTDEREKSRADGDTEGQTEDGQDAEFRLLPQDSRREAEVAEEVLGGHPEAGFEEALFGEGAVAEGSAGGSVRIGCPFRAQLIGLQLKMSFELCLEIFGLAPAPHKNQPSSGPRMRPIAAVSLRHWPVSCVNCLWPARVSL